ncbi:MAG: sulfatase, partial [Bacteroidetes bacterium]
MPGYDKHTPPTDNGILKDGKGYLSEGGIREPFIFRWPARIPAGKIIDTPIISHDLLPTYAEILNLTVQHTDGASLLPLLTTSGKLAERSLYWHHPHYSPQRGRPQAAIRQGDFKLVY